MTDEQPQQQHVDHDDDEEFPSDEPAFIDMNAADVEEVAVDDGGDEPMDDDDDDDDDVAMEGEEPSSLESLPLDESCCRIECHADAVYAVSSVPSSPGDDGVVVVCSGGGDDRAYLSTVSSSSYEVTATRNLSELRPHTDSVSSVAYNGVVEEGGRKLLAVGSYDGSVQVWDVVTSELLHRLEGPTDVEWIAWHPKGGTVLLAGSTDGTVWMFHALTAKCLQVFVGHEADVSCGTFTADGRFALSAGVDGTARVWAPRTGLSRHVFRFGRSPVTCITAHDALLLCGSENGSAHVCHVKHHKVVYTLRHAEGVVPPPMQQDHEDDEQEDTVYKATSVEAVGFFPGATTGEYNWCATGGVDGFLKIWDLGNNGQCRRVCAHHDVTGDAVVDAPGITRLIWHPTLPLVFTASTDGIVRLWDARTGNCIQTLTGGHVDIINDMDVSYAANGNATVLTGSDDGIVRMFQVNVNAALLANQ